MHLKAPKTCHDLPGLFIAIASGRNIPVTLSQNVVSYKPPTLSKSFEISLETRPPAVGLSLMANTAFQPEVEHWSRNPPPNMFKFRLLKGDMPFHSLRLPRSKLAEARTDAFLANLALLKRSSLYSLYSRFR